MVALRMLLQWVFVMATLSVGWTDRPRYNGKNFSLRILHTNDMHARFEPISGSDGKCSEENNKANECYGGFARMMTAVKEQRKEAKAEKVPLLFLNAGDTYQGTAWYTLYKWKVVVALTNLLKIDAMSLGNHEFDDGVTGLAPFLNKSRCPVLACNVDIRNETELEDLKKSHVFVKGGRQIGVIGYLTTETMELANTGKVKIYDEVEYVAKEAKALKESGVQIIIAVGHAGFDIDLKIAKNVPDVDVVVGGHTNTFLYTGAKPDIEVPAGLYPTIVNQTSGRMVAVVQAYAYTKYLGILNLKFNKFGELISAVGDPKLLNYKVPEDPAMIKAMKPWKELVLKETQKPLCTSTVFLDGFCRFSECNLGNLLTDAYVDYVVQLNSTKWWTNAPIALQQGGGIRSSIDPNSKNKTVLMGDIMTTMPFYNQLSIVNVTGQCLLAALEWSVFRYDLDRKIGRGEFLQVSGIRVFYNLAKPQGSRVVQVLVRCGECLIPRLVPLKPKKMYTVILPSFLLRGGDNFTMLAKYGKEIVKLDKPDTTIVAEFIEKRKIIYPQLEDRIIFINSTKSKTSIGTRLKKSIASALSSLMKLLI